jgi:6-phosphogluconolactonase
MGKVDLVRFESAEALAQCAAREWLAAIASPQHCAAFSGGRIAEQFFGAITSEARHRKPKLTGVHFFWADERCVPPNHPDSNYALMHTRLLQPLDVPPANIHRIKGELGPAAAAREASAEFAAIVRSVLDFVFLGMGEDGHVASIFPGDPISESPGEFYRPILNAPKSPPERVTLAMHAIAAARNVSVLVSGAGKERALGESLNSDRTPLGQLLKRRILTRVFAYTPSKPA